MTEVELERLIERQLEEIRAISDDEARFDAAQELLRFIEKRLNPAAAKIRNGAALGLHDDRGWTYDRIGERFKLKRSAVKRIIDNARGKPAPKRMKRPKAPSAS